MISALTEDRGDTGGKKGFDPAVLAKAGDPPPKIDNADEGNPAFLRGLLIGATQSHAHALKVARVVAGPDAAASVAVYLALEIAEVRARAWAEDDVVTIHYRNRCRDLRRYEDRTETNQLEIEIYEKLEKKRFGSLLRAVLANALNEPFIAELLDHPKELNALLRKAIDIFDPEEAEIEAS